MIPVAAGVLAPLNVHFNPMIAALCMSLSSLFVVGNALRLLLYKNKKFSADKKKSGGRKGGADGGENAENADNADNADENENNITAQAGEEEYMKKLITVEGMCCDHCAARVEKALSAVNGVVSADVKLKKNLAVVRSREEIADGELTKVIEEAGYKVTSISTK